MGDSQAEQYIDDSRIKLEAITPFQYNSTDEVLILGDAMNRKKLIDMIEVGTSLLRSFIAECNASSIAPSSFDDWNDADVVGHIVGWMDYSIDKLTCIKTGGRQNAEYSQVTSLSEINAILYGKMKDKSIEDIESAYLNSLGSYIKAVSLYSNTEVNLDTFDTGFNMELWRYMFMDTVIHPVQHILYQYLKKREYGKVSEAIGKSKEAFEEYSEGKQAYKLSEFAVDRPEYQKRLAEFGRLYSADKDAIEFAAINMNGNA